MNPLPISFFTKLVYQLITDGSRSERRCRYNFNGTKTVEIEGDVTGNGSRERIGVSHHNWCGFFLNENMVVTYSELVLKIIKYSYTKKILSLGFMYLYKYI